MGIITGLATAKKVIGGLTQGVGLFQGVKDLFTNKKKEENRQDARQVTQQGKLNEVNAKTSKELADYEQALKLKMWQDTNYTAQLREAEKAGVSKAAAIGGGGAGVGQGASVGTSGVGGGAASGTEGQMAGIQNRLMQSQIMNMDAQTNKTNAEAEKIKTTDTENVKADTEIKKIQVEFDKVRNEIQGLTSEEQAERIKDEAKKMMHEAHTASITQSVSENTQREQAEIIKNQALMQVVEIQAINQGIKLDKAKVKEITESLEQGWEKLRIDEKGVDVSKENMEKLTETMLWQAGIQATGQVINSLIDIRKMNMGGKQFDKSLKEKARQFDKGRSTSETKTVTSGKGKVRSITNTNRTTK